MTLSCTFVMSRESSVDVQKMDGGGGMELQSTQGLCSSINIALCPWSHGKRLWRACKHQTGGGWKNLYVLQRPESVLRLSCEIQIGIACYP